VAPPRKTAKRLIVVDSLKPSQLVPFALSDVEQRVKSQSAPDQAAAPLSTGGNSEQAAAVAEQPAPRQLPVGVRRGRLVPRGGVEPHDAGQRGPDYDQVQACANEAALSIDLEGSKSFLTPWLSGTDTLALVPPGHDPLDAVVATGCTRPGRLLIVMQSRDAAHREATRLRRHGLAVDALSTPSDATDRLLASLASSPNGVLFTGVDTFTSEETMSAMQRVQWDRVALADAQRVSELAPDFDPVYDGFVHGFGHLGRPPVLALVRAAPPSVRNDLPHRLGLRNPSRIDLSPIPENVALEVLQTDGGQRSRALSNVVSRAGRPTLVLCLTRADIQDAVMSLRAAGLESHVLDGTRPETWSGTDYGPDSILVGTTADSCPDDIAPALVVHHRAPASLEQYCRDLGKLVRHEPSRSVILAGPEDEAQAKTQLDRSRYRPEEMVALASALVRNTTAGSGVLLDALCSSAGLGRIRAESLLRMFEASGWVHSEGEWYKVTRDSSELMERARGLAARTRTARERDGHRLRSVAAYVISKGCRQESLRRHFGATASRPCGLCDACQSTAVGNGAEAAGTPPSDRAPNRRSTRNAAVGVLFGSRSSSQRFES